MKHLNIFIIYDGVHSTDKIFERLDEVIPKFSDLYSADTENYLIQSDMTLSDETLNKLWFAELVMPWKENKKRTDFRCTLSFYNLCTKTSYSEIKMRLEERGFKFGTLSDNADLRNRVFKWYHPLNRD